MQHVRYNEYEINIRKQGKGARDYLDEKVVMLCYTKHVNRNLKELSVEVYKAEKSTSSQILITIRWRETGSKAYR